MIKGFVTACRTLSLLPLPGKDATKMSSALPWFPVVGMLLGVILFGSAQVIHIALPKWPQFSAALLIFLSAILTRGLHLDGLADTADAFFSMTDKNRMLEIMKDSSVGTFGVLALIFVLLAKWLAVLMLFKLDATFWIVPAMVISRSCQVELATVLPYARATNGTGVDFVKGATDRHRVIAWAITLLANIATGPLSLLGVGLSWMAVRVLGIWFVRKVGGITGDLIGASSELIETACLVLFAIGMQSDWVPAFESFSFT